MKQEGKVMWKQEKLHKMMSVRLTCRDMPEI
jgi:hypothetical protein